MWRSWVLRAHHVHHSLDVGRRRWVLLDQLGNMQHALQILSWPARAGQNFLKDGLRPRATPECSLALALRALRARPCHVVLQYHYFDCLGGEGRDPFDCLRG